MTMQPDEIKRPNHKRNLLLLAGGALILVIAFNALGAGQCIANRGTITRDGLSLGCLFDFSNS